MKKKILLTGATDGIGQETAKKLIGLGHHVLLHGRNPEKLKRVADTLASEADGASIGQVVADLSRLKDVEAMAKQVAREHPHLDALINNAGVLQANHPLTEEGIDIRFMVNTLAPYVLTKTLLPVFESAGRIVNVSSAAQAPVNVESLTGGTRLPDMAAYSQSKLAITMWSRFMAKAHPDGPVIVAVNPASMLGSKMVKDAFGVAGGDLHIGADILIRAALSDDFADASGKYFDNDNGQFASPHPDALDDGKNEALVAAMETLISQLL